MSPHFTPAFHHRSQPRQAGFTLVEIMVGMVIGLLATLVIMQVFSVFETQKRATTGAADSLTNGNIALFKINRDVQAAGWAMVSIQDENKYFLSPFNCTAAALTKAEPGVTDVFPVSVVDSDNGTTSDSITLRYGTTERGGVPSIISATGPITIKSNFGCEINDITLAVTTGGACTISRVTGLPQLSADSATPGTVTLANATNAITGATLACLGNWREVTYRLNPLGTRNLEFRDSLGPIPAQFDPVVAGVVNVQIQYGISASRNNTAVVAWVDPTGIWAVPSDANRKLIKAIRIAIVARDEIRNLQIVTDACNPVANTGLCAWADIPGSPAPVIDLSADPDWQHYRYRVFETIIPLRNAIWASQFLT